MFLLQAFKPNNDFWKYILGSVIIIFFNVAGYIPLGIALFIARLSGRALPIGDELMTYFEPNLMLFLIMFTFVTALAGIFLVIRRFHGQTVREVTTARKKTDWHRIFFSFGIWAVFSAISVAISYYTAPENFVINFKPIPFAILAVIAIVMIPIQTSVEEYVFRGYLMQGFAVLAKNKWFPLLLTSVIFGCLHLGNPEVGKMGYILLVYYIGTGFFLGVITLMDDGIELALGFHAANNLVSALLVTSAWSVFQTHSVLKDISEPTAGVEVIFPVVIIFPILLFIFSKKYKWSGWKEKLTGEIVLRQPENNQID
ncbi:MAG: CPBP family intramembrane metalloprotease [Flavobacterium sp.]|nr:CPBP family intramembrane metalloprotease [Flavobacterium sp.]